MRSTLSEKVLLVVPPFSSAKLPSLGVGQLKANLERAGHSTEVLYLNFTFAARIGFNSAEWVSGSTFTTLLGELVFSTALFGSDPDRMESYLSEVFAGTSDFEALEHRFPDQSPAAIVAQWCEEACAFCDGEGLDAILSSGATVVGFSSSFQQNCAALALLTRLKRKRPDVVTVMGGANCEGVMGQELIARFPEIDFVGQGECDHALVTLVGRLCAGAAAHDIAGIRSRHPLSSVQHSRPLTGTDLDALPYPNFDEYFEQLSACGFDERFQPMLAMETARGCWWGAKHHCTFCGLNQNGMHFRSKSPLRALEEIDWLVDRYGPHTIAVADNILDMQYFKTVLPGLAETQRTTLFYETKSNLTRSQVRMLAAARINLIQPGIESLSDESLRLMRKGCSKAQNVQLLKWCAEYGVKVGWNYLIGFPGEDEDELTGIAEEVELLHHLDPPANSGVLRVDRFSPYFNDPGEFGLAPITPAAAYRQVYPLPDESLERIAYFFESDLLASKANGAGIHVVQAMAARWREAHGRSFLLVISRRDTLIVIDTRRCARRWVHRLTGLHRAIYEHCDAAHTLPDIVKAMRDSENPDVVEDVVESLVRDRLLLAAGSRYVNLGVVPGRRLTFENPPSKAQSVRRASRRTRVTRDVMLLGRMLRDPQKMVPRAIHRLGDAWCRRRNRLVRRAVLIVANVYSDSRIKRI